MSGHREDGRSGRPTLAGQPVLLHLLMDMELFPPAAEGSNLWFPGSVSGRRLPKHPRGGRFANRSCGNLVNQVVRSLSGCLKAVRLEIFGPVFPEFLAEVTSRRCRQSRGCPEVYPGSAVMLEGTPAHGPGEPAHLMKIARQGTITSKLRGGTATCCGAR